MSRPTTPGRWRSTTLAASGWVALLATLLPAGSPVRSVAVAAFMMWCPGAALVRRFWPGTDKLERTVLSIALSVSVSILLTELQTFGGMWQPRLSVALLAILTTALAAPRPAFLSRSKEASTL